MFRPSSGPVHSDLPVRPIHTERVSVTLRLICVMQRKMETTVAKEGVHTCGAAAQHSANNGEFSIFSRCAALQRALCVGGGVVNVNLLPCPLQELIRPLTLYLVQFPSTFWGKKLPTLLSFDALIHITSPMVLFKLKGLTL